MDAAVAAAAVLTVAEPTSNGLGGDAFALIWSEKDRCLYGLNSSGPAPRLASIERVLADGADRDGKMPRTGWAPVTVPGIPMAWAEINRRFGLPDLPTLTYRDVVYRVLHWRTPRQKTAGARETDKPKDLSNNREADREAEISTT